MASGLRDRLRRIAGAAPQPPAVREGGVLVRTFRQAAEPELYALGAAGLRRIGWSGRAFDVTRCLFLDTETTGLSGGAGTVAFLVGCGYVCADAFVIEQYLMRDYGDEPELIARLARRMADFDCVCTYNGRAFDMPLLEARFTMMRMRERWRELENLDLLTPARRAWKLRLGHCRLADVEQKVLGIVRQGDLPGGEVPQRYFDYLKTGNADLLQDILDHNRQDIATLKTLLVRLCALYDAPPSAEEVRDLYSLGRALERGGELGCARETYREAAVPRPVNALSDLRDRPVSAMANQRIYFIERKNQNVEGMRSVLEEMLRRGQMPLFVHTELSKLYEHRLGDPARALVYAQKALGLAEDDAAASDARRRIERLRRKTSRTQEKPAPRPPVK